MPEAGEGACTQCACDAFHANAFKPSFPCGDCQHQRGDHTRDPSTPWEDPKAKADAAAEEQAKSAAAAAAAVPPAEDDKAAEGHEESKGDESGQGEQAGEETKGEPVVEDATTANADADTDASGVKDTEEAAEGTGDDDKKEGEASKSTDTHETGAGNGDGEDNKSGDSPEGGDSTKPDPETEAAGDSPGGDDGGDKNAEGEQQEGGEGAATVEEAAEPEKTEEQLAEEAEKAAKKKAQRAETRKKILEEIVSSEAVYIKKLQALIDVYIRPLEVLTKRDPIVDKSEMRAIFANVEMLVKLNEGLKESLDERGEDESMGQIFIDIAPMLKMYIPYVNNFDNSLTAISEANKSPLFQQFCEEAAKNEKCGGLNLSSLLIMPVQRIPRYELLLRDLLKNTEDDHPDFDTLNAAMSSIQEIAQIVNTKKTEQENMRRVLEIQQQFSPKPTFENLVKPHRRFIRHDKLTKKPTTHAGMDRRRHFFLFNDQIVYAKRNKSTDKYEYKGAIPLQFSQIRSIKDDEKLSNLFEIYSMQSKTRFVIYAPEPHIKEAWIKDVNDAIQVLNEQVMQKELNRTKSAASVRSLASVEKNNAPEDTSRNTVA